MQRSRYVASAVVFGALFILIGFFADAVSSGAEGGYAFGFWLSHPGLWFWWFIAGGAIGAAARYAISNR